MRWAVILGLAACTSELQPPTGRIDRYVTSAQLMPVTNAEARALGLDLNGDGGIDNGLGRIFVAIAAHGTPPTEAASGLLDRGAIIQLARLQRARPSDPDDSLALTFLEGHEPTPPACADAADVTCRRHLAGDARFQTHAAAADPLLGRNGRPALLGPGSTTVILGFYGDAVPIELVGARVKLVDTGPDRLIGNIGGGIRTSDVEAKLKPRFARYLEQVVAEHCSREDPPYNCGCPADSEAKTWLGYFDINPRDCVVSIDEVLNNALVTSLFTPDVELDGEQLLSFGFGFEAVPAHFEP